MAKGENIFRRRDGRWEARYSKGRELSGKIKYGYCYGKTYREAKEKAEKCKAALANGNPLPTSRIQNLFSAYCIRDYILSTNLAARYERRASLENADSFRFQSFWIGLRELIQYPMGGRASQIYRHNMWLDVGRVSGIIPFCLLLVYSIKNFANVTVIWKNTKILPSLRYLLLFLYIGAYVNCFVEPIWEGALNFFLALCVVDGMVSAMMRRLENDPTPEESVSDTSNLHTDL